MKSKYNKKPRSKFRGIEVGLVGSFPCKMLPKEALSGADPKTYRLDRWQPISEDDKLLSNSLVEKSREWVGTSQDTILYGVERWGMLPAQVSESYREWFAIIVLHPNNFDAFSSLKIAETAGFVKSDIPHI